MSATIKISLGPASISISQWPYTAFLARVTKILPGPVILSTRGIVSVPKAMAAIAWAPPILKILDTPASLAATST